MWDSSNAAISDAAGADVMLGDVRALAAQMGAGGHSLLPATPAHAAVNSVPVLREFAARYVRETLAASEWPVILQAWQLAREGRARELIALDQEWTRRNADAAFAEASFRVGRRQLGQLRPLRHERVVLRYLAALEAGEARGWHPVVYGVTLAVFNLPLRQGLVNYGTQTLGGFVDATERAHRLPAAECQALLDEATAQMPALLPPLPGATVFQACH